MNKCLDIINSSRYFTQHNLTSQRVLNDCITFINIFFTKTKAQMGEPIESETAFFNSKHQT